MSGCCSAISRSTSAMRARTELMFQEAILSRLRHVPPLSPVSPHKQKAPAPGAWSEGRPSVVTQGIPRTRVTGGNPGHIGTERLI